MRNRFQSVLTIVSLLALAAAGAAFATDYAIPGVTLAEVSTTVLALVLNLAATGLAFLRLGASTGDELHNRPFMKITPIIWLFNTGFWVYILITHLMVLGS